MSIGLMAPSAWAQNIGQGHADELGKLTAKAIFDLDNELIGKIVESYVSQETQIFGVRVIDSLDNETLFSLHRDRSEQIVFNREFPESVLARPAYTSSSIFRDEEIGIIEVFYEQKSALNLTPAEENWIRENPIISVGIEQWYPYIRFNDNGDMDGIAADFLDFVFDRTGLQMNMVPGVWSDLLAEFRKGNIDLLPATYYTEERATYGLYSSPYFTGKEFIYVRDDRDDIKGFDDLSGKKIAIPKDFGTIPKIREKFPDIEIVLAEDQADAIYRVLNREVDATFEPQIVMDEVLRTELIKNIKAISQTDFEASKLYFFSHFEKPILQSILTKALDSITLEERKAIINKWLIDSDPTLNYEAPELIEFDQNKFIFTYIAYAFLLTGGIIVIVWFAKGRPRKLSIRDSLFLISFAYVGFIAAIGGLVALLLDSDNEQLQIEETKYLSLNLALELKQSSDELTRFARTYAVTGEPIYEEYFRAIIKIRNGEIPHPVNFDRSYWDHVIAGKVDFNTEGELYSIEEKMKEYGLTEQEQDLLNLAKQNSDDLINLEDIAMNAVKGIYQDVEGLFTIRREADLNFATQLLHSPEYHEAKSKIMFPIDQFFRLLEERSTNELYNIRARIQAILTGITILTLFTISFSIYVFFLMRRKIVLPLVGFQGAANQIADGHYDHEISHKTKDELGDLAKAFNQMSGAISTRTQDLISRENQLTDAYEVISSSINYASHIQKSVLPDMTPLEAVLKQHFVIWEPRDVVGGDIYWCDFWGDGIHLTLADCTGHGVPGAFVTLLATGAFKEAKNEVFSGDLEAVITRFHQNLQQTLGQHSSMGTTDDGLELGSCFIDPDMTRMFFVGARFDLFIVENGEVQIVKGTKQGIGYRNIPAKQHYVSHEVELKPGRRFYMTSDGVIDQVGGPKRRGFGKNRFKELLLSIQHLPMEVQKQEIMNTVFVYQGDENRRDDISVLGFEI